MSNKKVITRYAPSPTGYQHVAGIRTALYNYFVAKKNGGEFILRIEDTDQERFVPEAEQYIYNCFKWLGIEFDKYPDNGSFRQSERKDIYRKYAFELVNNNYAYFAFDTTEELEEAKEKNDFFAYNSTTRMSMKNSLTLPKDEVDKLLKITDNWTIRIKFPDEPIKIEFNDEIRGLISFVSSELDDKVIFKKSTNLPTYHMASVLDDFTQGVTNVIRGSEWVNSTPLHIYLYNCLGWGDSIPSFTHLPLVLGPDGSKLSKRDGNKYGFSVFPLSYYDEKTNEQVSGFKEDGYVPSALINLLSMIGWNDGTEQEIFTLDELIQKFDLSRVNKAGGKFNPVKAKWFNAQHIRRMEAEELLPMVKEDFSKRGIELPDATLLRVITDNKGKIDSINGLYDVVSYLFEKPTEYDRKALKKWRDDSAEKIQLFVDELYYMGDGDWNEEKIQKTFEKFVHDSGVKFGLFAPLIRVFLTGRSNGASMFGIMEMIGKQETINRLTTYEYPVG